ncbi:alpha-(1,3)-fucosyltransferase 7 [Genypterus blacodes]|uniref:alpha-(1,3)-fucosyltransferase 7 n=1 Tax=Genypterus blacodes TaxID=154954 RepID=UPI003F7701B2
MINALLTWNSAPMRNLGSRFYTILFFLILFNLLFMLFFTFLNQKPNLQKQNPAVPQKNISILLWQWPFGHPYRLRGDVCLHMYNISHCSLTKNRAAFPTADIVVFHHHELTKSKSSLPLHWSRPAFQHWVWMSMEPPVNNANLTHFNGLFNWTMSFRRDADISIPYGKTVVGGGNPSYVVPQNRSCLVSWVVSKYFPNQARAAVFNSLKSYVPIEVYGRWNKKPLLQSKLMHTIQRCFFYLAFENTEARDYISEKLWKNAFQAGSVPVVLGPSRATYEALAPPRSFIHVNDFTNTADLAAYLKHLASDRKAYEVYFHWHHTHSIKTYTDWRERLCQICVKYPTLKPNQVYQDLETWVSR